MKKAEMMPKSAATSLYPLMYSSSSLPESSFEMRFVVVSGEAGTVLRVMLRAISSWVLPCVCTDFSGSRSTFFDAVASGATSSGPCSTFSLIEVGGADRGLP